MKVRKNERLLLEMEFSKKGDVCQIEEICQILLENYL